MDRMRAKNFEIGSSCYCAMIDACTKAGDVEAAAEWYSKMRASGLTPGARSLSALIITCAKSGRAEDAESWLGRMEECSLAPDIVAYSSAIDACSKADEPERAMRIFGRMQAQGVKANIVAYSALARPFARRGDWAAVETLGERMEEDGIRKNEYFLYALLDAYTNSKPRQPQRATRAFREAMAEGLEANEHVLAALARVLGRAQARELCREAVGSAKRESVEGGRGTPQAAAKSVPKDAPWRKAAASTQT